jgi:hypothetical protein
VLEGRYLDRADPEKGRFRSFILTSLKFFVADEADRQRWALSVLDRVVEKLRNEFVQHGRREHFERLKVFLLGRADTPYTALAREMNTSEGALKVAIHRLRKRYRDLFRQEIADTVADPAEVEPEIRYLAAVLSKKEHSVWSMVKWGSRPALSLSPCKGWRGTGKQHEKCAAHKSTSVAIGSWHIAAE